jgi:PAS domain S-box-containing protein
LPPSALFDALPLPAFALASDGRVIAWNDAAERAYGWPAPAVLGEVTPFAGPAAARVLLERAAARDGDPGAASALELALVARDGSPRRARVRCSPLPAADGQRGAVFLDVTELRRTEDDLRRALDVARNAESRFTHLVEASPDLMVIHRAGRILYANPAMAALAGRSVADLAGTPVLDWVHPDDRAPLAERLRADGRLAAREWRLLGAGGRHVPVEFIAVGLEMPDGPARVAIGRDLSDRKRTEERLQRSDRLASLGTLAAGVAHELNNPLSFILSNSEWAIDRLARPGGPSACELEEVVRALRDVVQGSQRMRVIVSDLRSAARSETATDTLASVDLRRVVEYATQLTSADLRRRARLEVELERVSPVLGSETRLAQVLVNLLLNAAHAMPGDDATRNVVRVTLGEEPGQVVLTVSDNGCGIAPSNRAHLFEPFFTTKPVGQGTGLGLWVCHGIVAGHGGTIEVESAEGRGTTFRVLLPAQQAI